MLQQLSQHCNNNVKTPQKMHIKDKFLSLYGTYFLTAFYDKE